MGVLKTMIARLLIERAPVGMQANSFSELAMNVTNITSPVNASLTAGKMIVGACTPPQIKYPVNCAILALQLGLYIFISGTVSVTTAALSC